MTGNLFIQFSNETTAVFTKGLLLWVGWREFPALCYIPRVKLMYVVFRIMHTFAQKFPPVPFSTKKNYFCSSRSNLNSKMLSSIPCYVYLLFRLTHLHFLTTRLTMETHDEAWAFSRRIYFVWLFFRTELLFTLSSFLGFMLQLLLKHFCLASKYLWCIPEFV